MWRVFSKLRFVVYLVVVVVAAMHFGGARDGTSRAGAQGDRSPYKRFYGMTAQRGKAWAEVANGRIHSLNLDVHLRCARGISATSRLLFADRGPHGLRRHGNRFKSSWTKDGLTARVKGRLVNRGGPLVQGKISVSGRFANAACRSGTVRWSASPAPLVKLSPGHE
ncbi:MAG TPA: hypothetical protein VF545_09810 [Thermoleophilaceae bacterium]|jgi:hypothetical protein